ncbi:uncharacterized protein LOC121756812 isoform X1 [Salvia splendens]|uniref:uncharacterized protein LOC121756812 isoform X1 n=1 Tax=Salvia splendens TaxID=180675 RepID=UPI001C25D322|nr:uncharacterized protein LOC121756812 isoform X1 [Salvia splendens]XP_042008154.1 uncharacterized protein LOC121756812 isoform X1 [Salvia splendens]
MAADQRKKKRVNAASLSGCTSREKYRVNRKKLHAQQHDLNMRPKISLEWDSRKKSVVSRKEQIGFSKRHLIPFIEPGPRGHNVLADVVPIPSEIFDLDNLSEVLSYEVWQSHLSDKERSFLLQFLPKEVDPDAIVRELLSGDNFHFGNPFMKWSASICLGELHPDNVLNEEQSLKASKKTYYSFLENYHTDMIENLQMWKDKWSGCKDPEVDIMQNIWSSRKHVEKTMPASDARFYGAEENHAATPDSCSWPNSEMAYSSENQNQGTVQGESYRRRDFLKKISDSSSSGLKVVGVAHRKGEKIHQWNIQQNDGAKYMSYIKVSKEQHELVKSSIKYAGNNIQPMALNNVLGSLDALNVQPFARFEEEERKKLHEYWVKLVTRDIPVGFASWRKRRLQRRALTQTLGEEVGQKVELQENNLDYEKNVSSNGVMELSDGEGEVLPSDTVEEGEKEQSDDSLLDQNDNAESINEMATEIEDKKETRNDCIFEKRAKDSTEMDEDEDEPNHVIVQDHSDSLNNSPRSTMITSSSPGFLQDQHQQQISSLDSNPHANSMEMESHGDSGSAKREDPQIVSGYSGIMNHAEVPLSQGASLAVSNDIWPVSDVHTSYYHSTASNSGYASTHELSIGHPQLMQHGQSVPMFNLPTNRLDKVARKDLLHRPTYDMSFFGPYANQDRSELLHSLLKGQSTLPYHQVQKHSGLDFQPGSDLLMEMPHFSGHFREHVHPPPVPPMDMRQKRLNDLYVHPNIQESIYSGNRFTSVPRQEDLAVNVHDWANVSSVRMPVAHHLNSGELGRSWYAGDNGNRDGWHSLEPVNGFNSGSSSDQTLFSVLSECNELPRASYDAAAVVSSERLVQPGSYNGIGGGGGILPSSSSSSNFLPLSANPLNYLSGHESWGSIRMNNLDRMGLPTQQNSGIQESIGKPFLKSWNQ